MNGYGIGMLAKSMAGHDREKIYMIKEVRGEYVYLVDGRLRQLEHPKKKKRKHVQIIKEQYPVSKMDDVQIRRILKKWN